MLRELNNIGHSFHLTTWIKQDYHYNSNLIQHDNTLDMERMFHAFMREKKKSLQISVCNKYHSFVLF